MRLESFDLNLLMVFEAIERERSVTGAGSALNLSQPAVSHALTRLRRQLGDRLFVRSPAGMVPTPRASEMVGPIRQAIVQLRSALRLESFDPATSRQTFSIAMNNFAAIVLAAPLAVACASRAPNVRLVIRPGGTLDTEALLGRGVLDIAIRAMGEGGRGRSRLLLRDRHVAVMRRGHPRAAATLTMAALAGANHLKITSVDEDDRFIDRKLAQVRLSRAIVLEAPYLAASGVLGASDLVAVMAQRIAAELCRAAPLVARPLPFRGPPIQIGMMWTDIHDDKPGHGWLRALVQSVADESAAVDPGPDEPPAGADHAAMTLT